MTKLFKIQDIEMEDLDKRFIIFFEPVNDNILEEIRKTVTEVDWAFNSFDTSKQGVLGKHSTGSKIYGFIEIFIDKTANILPLNMVKLSSQLKNKILNTLSKFNVTYYLSGDAIFSKEI